MRYENVFITGASSGIGAGLAEKLVARGARVYAAARRMDRLEELSAATADSPGELIPVQLDVNDTGAVIEAIRGADEETDGLDLVIANAGVGRIRNGRKLTWEDVSPVLQTNVLGASATLTAALPAMIERGRGQLVAISSLAGLRGLPRNAAYSASKAALSTFLESLRVDLNGTGIYVTCVHPGFIKTPMTEDNKSYMPLLMEEDAAVSKIMKGIDRRKTVVEFPWLLAKLVRFLRFLPDRAYDFVARLT